MLNRILLLLALLAPLSAAAQDLSAVDEQDEEDGTICIAIGHLWTGSPADLRDIERVPVPESFRRQNESSNVCTRLQLVDESLIDWHLNFGSLQSAMAALAYLEHGYLRGIPSPERYVEQLERAWSEAQQDIRKARAISGRAEATRSEQERFIRRSEPIQRLQTLGYTAYGSYRTLAEQYLRVAEEHGWLKALEKAEIHLGAVRAGAKVLASFRDRSPGDRLVYFDLDEFRTHGIEMRTAVLRAKVTRAPDAIERAETILRANERPYYRRLADGAFTGGGDFCDISGVSQSEALKEACEEDDEIQEQVVNFILARAMLDLVADEENPSGWRSNVSAALRLLEAERHFESSRCCGALTTNEVLLRLRLALADYHRRQHEELEVDSAVKDALDQLREAESLITPFDSPARFERIGRDWLELYRKWEATRAEEGDDPHPRDARYAAYFEATLANLDAIAQAVN